LIERDLEHLERSLTLLARAIAYPRTPPIAERVGDRLSYEATSTRTAPAWALAGLALAGLVVLLSVLIGAVSPARNSIAEVFDGINIFQTDDLPSDVSPEIEGTPTSLANAENTLGFRIPLPSYPDDLSPKTVLLQDFGVVKATVLSFDHQATGEFIVFATNATVGKILSSEAKADPVGGFHGEAYWLRGLRIVRYEAAGDAIIEESMRATDTNTLIWEQDGHVFRLEGNLSLDDAVVIARSLR